MPKLIDYPRTSYTGAWELAEITDDTGGKSTIENAARKLNRKVSGSFKAIIGSAVKFGLVTSKREMLTTTTLFKRIKHAYDKQEELVFHREAFLTPPLFTQLCRKFRSRELPVQMLDVMLIREFGVEEINAQGVAKAFVDGARMVGLLDENNTITDIDALSAKQTPRRQLADQALRLTTFQPETDINMNAPPEMDEEREPYEISELLPVPRIAETRQREAPSKSPRTGLDAIANLFGFLEADSSQTTPSEKPPRQLTTTEKPIQHRPTTIGTYSRVTAVTNDDDSYQIQISGPGINTILSISEEEDISLAIALLEKIRRQLNS